MTELFHDQTHNVLVYRTDPIRLHEIATAIPEAKQINGSMIALPYTLQNAQTLRFKNYPVPAIITDTNYDWPIERGRHALPHQKVMANFMVTHPRSFNLSDMGTMKTLATLWAADWLMKQHAVGTFRALVVAPLSTLERVWANAIFSNFLSRRTFKILHGSAEKRLAEFAKPADFYIINFDGVGVGTSTKKKRLELEGLSWALADRHDIQLAIVDEATAYKHANTVRHRVARMVFGDKPYLWLLTGTPTPQAPTDAYGIAHLVNRAYGKSYRQFRMDTMMQVSQFKWVPHKDGYDKARRLLSPSIRYDIKDVWDGPEMTTQQRQVGLTPDQAKLMAKLKKDLQIWLKPDAKPITAVNEAALRTKFLQISMGMVYDATHDAHAVDASHRFNELVDVIEQAPGKILIFAPFTSVLSMLHRECSKRWAELRQKGEDANRWWSALVYGDVGQHERSKIFEAFQQEGGPTILVADPGTMAHGIELWRAQTVIWYGATDKAELYQQANKRAHRPGQRYPVTVVQLVSNPLEREIYKRLESNTNLQGALLDIVRRGDL